MPITIKQGQMKIKNDQGQYELIDVIGNGDVQQSVENWLDENVTGATGPVVIDTSLSISGAAADAKKVGDMKVNKPTVNPNGTDGQLLRSNGDGTTTWSSYASPTSAQVADAVEDWLDEHPEATTTVEDGSLTYQKLVTGTMGYVIPQQFGAVGDGITDDTDALKACMDYALENNYAIHLPMGTYITRPSVLFFEIADKQSLVVIGDGQNSIIKLKDNSLNGSWSQIFTIEVEPSLMHANDVIFSNFCIDGNRRNQGEIAPDSYAYEASQCISFRNGNGLVSDEQYLDRVIVSNMRFYDPVADCVNISGSTSTLRIRDIFLDRIVSTDRHGTRNDIGITGNPMHFVSITNCDCGSIHFEYNSTPEDENVILYKLSNCIFGVCTLGAKIDLEMNNCHIKRAFSLGGFRKAVISDSQLCSSGPGYAVLSENGDCTFNNCQILIDESSNGSIKPFYVRRAKSAIFFNCEFIYNGIELASDFDGDGINDHVSGHTITVENGWMFPLTIDSCRFDKRLYDVVFVDGNNVKLKNMVIGTGYAIGGQTLEGHVNGAKIEFENIRLGRDCKRAVSCGLIHGSSGGIVFDGVLPALRENYKFYGTVTNRRSWLRNQGNFRRKVAIEEPLTFAYIKANYSEGTEIILFKGDEFVYDGPEKEIYPEKWIVKESARTTYASNWNLTGGVRFEERFFTIGSGYGHTKKRPTCLLSPGFEYFDMDLGHKVIWNGSGWTNCDGTPALNHRTETGKFASIVSDGARNLLSLELSFGPTQDGTGDPSSENVRALTGQTSATITKYGKNLTPIAMGADLVTYGILDNPNYSYSISGLDPQKSYTLQTVVTENYATDSTRRLYLYGVNTTTFMSHTATNPPELKSITLKPNSTGVMRIRHHKSPLTDESTYGTTFTQIMLSCGSASSEYEAYQEPTTFATVDWESIAGTVYAGKIDFINGKLYAYPYYASYNGETLVGPWISSMDVYDPENPDTPPTTGAQVVDLGGTPTVYDLTPQTLAVTAGTNNLVNDVNGDFTVEYFAI